MIKQYKNGNLHIKFDAYDFESARYHDVDYHDAIEILCNNYDLMPISDSYCIGNSCEAYNLMYNGGSDYYTLISLDIFKLLNGNTIILHPLREDYITEYIVPYLAG